MPADIETMFFTGATPWHGLGKKVDGLLTSADAIRAAGLDWTVGLRPVFDGNGKPIPGWQAVTREKDNRTFGLVQSKYRPIQNAQAFDFMDTLVQSREAMYETAGALGNGARIWLLSRITKTIRIDGDPSDIDTFLLLSGAHDGNGAVKTMVTPTRVVCRNTLNAAIRGAKVTFSIRHTGDITSKLAAARETLHLTFDYLTQFEEAMQTLTTIPMSLKEVRAFTTELIPIPEGAERSGPREEARDAIAGLFAHSKTLKGVPNTAYRTYQAVAEYSDHVRPMRASKAAPLAERVATSIESGAAFDLKQTALGLLVPAYVTAKN